MRAEGALGVPSARSLAPVSPSLFSWFARSLDWLKRAVSWCCNNQVTWNKETKDKKQYPDNNAVGTRQCLPNTKKHPWKGTARQSNETQPMLFFHTIQGVCICSNLMDYKSAFQLSVGSNSAFALILHCYALWLVKKSRATSSTNQK